jgi:hypothetical protein
MKEPKLALFGKSKAMEAEIDDFLDKISEGGLRFEQGITAFIDGATPERLTEQADQMRATEAEGHRLRRAIETQLYTEMLIPDFRGDVLSLLEDLNYVLGKLEDIFLSITVEQPTIDEPYRADFKLLASSAVKTIEAAILGSRAFFRNIAAVRDHLAKVYFHEDECDQIAIGLKRAIFSANHGLDHKIHLRYYVDKIDGLADEAEEVGDWLAIYSIKRSL